MEGTVALKRDRYKSIILKVGRMMVMVFMMLVPMMMVMVPMMLMMPVLVSVMLIVCRLLDFFLH